MKADDTRSSVEKHCAVVYSFDHPDNTVETKKNIQIIPQHPLLELNQIYIYYKIQKIWYSYYNIYFI